MKAERWKRFITVESSENIDSKRKKSVMYFFTYIGGTIIFYFAFKTPSNDLILKLSLFATASFLYINAIASIFHKNTALASQITGIAVIPLVLAVVYTGGYADTGLYWAYPFPITLLVFFGPLRGLFLNMVMFVAIILMIYNPEYITANYRPEEVVRFAPTFLVNVTLCLIAEFFRSRSHKELSSLNLDRLKQANTDVLTNLPNRRFIDSVFMDAAKNDQSGHFPMTVIAVDIDHFKKVNDTYGHDIGDIVLKHVARLLRRNTREMDVVARIGGEEFLIIFPRTSNETGVIIADKIRKIISDTPFLDNDLEINVTVSMGCTEVKKYVFMDDAFKIADKLLYQAKANGRNRMEEVVVN
ncbi:MAG: GGDEF domain-containing protein [Kangiellaceae bacterium]|nr:GGDEF domain-containing protein [Kangiellaceae bacterium]